MCTRSVGVCMCDRQPLLATRTCSLTVCSFVTLTTPRPTSNQYPTLARHVRVWLCQPMWACLTGATFTRLGAGQCLDSSRKVPTSYHGQGPANNDMWCAEVCSGLDACTGYSHRSVDEHCRVYGNGLDATGGYLIDWGQPYPTYNNPVGGSDVLTQADGETGWVCFGKETVTTDITTKSTTKTAATTRLSLLIHQVFGGVSRLIRAATTTVTTATTTTTTTTATTTTITTATTTTTK